MASRKNNTKTTIGNSRIERYYNKIVLGFIVVTSALVLAIVYFSFSKTVITVTAAPVEHELTMTIPLTDMNALAFVTEVEGSHLGTNVGTEKTKPGKAGGTVKIINNYNANQPLVATTRLLSKEGILFRTQETVTVPAGGSVEVPVLADQEGETGNIGASSFEIVALWEGLKDKIYAESVAPMTGGLVNVSALSNEEILRVKKELQARLVEDAATKFRDDITTRENLPENAMLLPAETFTVTVLSEKANAEAGQEVTSVEVTQKLSVQGMVVNRLRAETLIQEAIQKQLASGATVITTPTLEEATLTLTNITTNESGMLTGDVNIATKYTSTIGSDHEILRTENLVNKTEQEVQNYLRGFAEVQDVAVSFSPFWVTKTPSLPDNITITVK